MIVELQQAGIFRLEGMDAALTEQVLASACANALFPYARETVDSLVTKGTFPPLMLAPMNFDALYAEAKRRAAERDRPVLDSCPSTVVRCRNRVLALVKGRKSHGV